MLDVPAAQTRRPERGCTLSPSPIAGTVQTRDDDSPNMPPPGDRRKPQGWTTAWQLRSTPTALRHRDRRWARLRGRTARRAGFGHRGAVHARRDADGGACPPRLAGRRAVCVAGPRPSNFLRGAGSTRFVPRTPSKVPCAAVYGCGEVFCGYRHRPQEPESPGGARARPRMQETRRPRACPCSSQLVRAFESLRPCVPRSAA